MFELIVYGDAVTSDAAWSLLNHLIQHPVDVSFWDGLKNQAQPKPIVRTGIACGLEWFPPDAFWTEVCYRYSRQCQAVLILLS